MQPSNVKFKVHEATSSSSIVPPEQNEANPRFKSHAERANLFSFVYFTYAWDLLKAAFTASKEGKMITAKDLVTFPWSRRADTLSARFTTQLSQQKAKNGSSKLNLSWAILWTVKWRLLRIIVLETLFIFARIFSAWIVKKLIDSYVIAEQADGAWKWAGILSACLVVAFHLEHHYNHCASFLPNHIQNALINLVYGKITRLSTNALTKISTGRLINICTNGVNLFEQLGLFVCNVFVGIFALIAGGALLWQYFGVCSLVGLGYIVFGILGNNSSS